MDTSNARTVVWTLSRRSMVSMKSAKDRDEVSGLRGCDADVQSYQCTLMYTLSMFIADSSIPDRIRFTTDSCSWVDACEDQKELAPAAPKYVFPP